MALTWCVALLGLMWLTGTTALAQTPTPDEINQVARELWCPLCAGVRLDVCELKACEQMREVIALKLSQGATPEEIKAYFVEQYGPQVLGEPPREGFTLLAWVLPFAFLAAGAGLLGYLGYHWSQHRRTVTATATASSPEIFQDEYVRRLEEELRRLD
ncbi:MAG: cytochrome c-type biogenesis protein CcmH [Anaerolineae bacterium]|nr:cytochrome c-type biogenesis protein CcmH [Anaerolineae bacterium]